MKSWIYLSNRHMEVIVHCPAVQGKQNAAYRFLKNHTHSIYKCPCPSKWPPSYGFNMQNLETTRGWSLPWLLRRTVLVYWIDSPVKKKKKKNEIKQTNKYKNKQNNLKTSNGILVHFCWHFLKMWHTAHSLTSSEDWSLHMIIFPCLKA